METNNRNVNIIKEILQNMPTDEIVDIWNEYAETVKYYNSIIYELDYQFNEVLAECEPLEIAQKIYYGNFGYSDNYFTFDGYCNIVSFDYANSENSPIDFDEIAIFILENNYSFENAEIQEELEKIETEDKEEKKNV